jgi:hypothetical protein
MQSALLPRNCALNEAGAAVIGGRAVMVNGFLDCVELTDAIERFFSDG